MKKLSAFCIVFALCMAVALTACAATVASGTCGDNARWALDSTGTLTISGKGDMADYESDYYWDEDDNMVDTCNAPWYAQYASSIKKIVISSGITSIGDYAFFGTAAESVQMASTVTSTGMNSFDNCTALTDVTLSSKLQTLGWGTFSGCESLKTISLPSSLKTIEDSAFSGCYALESISIPSGVTSLPSGVFQWCRSLYIVALHNGITSIGERAFSECEKLIRLDLPSNLRTISANAFYSSSLVYLQIPATVETIGSDAFEKSLSLSNVRFLGSTPPAINATAFSGVTADLYYPASSSAWTDSVMGQYGGKLQWIPTNAPIAAIHGTCGPHLTWTLTPEGLLTISGVGFMDSYEFARFINFHSPNKSNAPWGQYTRQITEVVVESGVASIGDYAFQHCLNLRNVSIPQSITNYGKGVFSHCKSLQQFDIPRGIRVLPEGMLEYCESLRHITIPDTVVKISPYVFSGCFNLESLVLPDSVTTIDNWAFSSTSLKSVRLSDNITYLGKFAFSLCHDLKEVHLGKGIKTIPVNCFEDTLVLEEITIPPTVERVESGAFCTSGTASMFHSPCAKNITFTGDAPVFADDAFMRTTATIRYPLNNSTWASLAAGKPQLEGTLTWQGVSSGISLTACTTEMDYTPVFYTGEEVIPQITVKFGKELLTKNTDYTIAYRNNVNAGTATAVITGKGTYYGTVELPFEILQQYPTLTFSAPSVTKKTGDGAFTNMATIVTDGAVSFTSTDTDVATVNTATGLVTIKGAGSTTIHLQASAGLNYRADTASYLLTVEKVSTANPLTWSELAFSFSNSSTSFGYPNGYRIPLDRYMRIYSATEAKMRYATSSPWGGSCYGFSTSSAMMNVEGSGLAASQFGAYSVRSLTPTHASSSLGMNLTEVLETMQVSWSYSAVTAGYQDTRNDLQGLLDEVTRSTYTRKPVVIAMYHPSAGHALLAYDVKKISDTTTHILIYDCNYPRQERYIRVATTPDGTPTDWYYAINDYYNCSNNYAGCSFLYLRYDAYSAAWRNRIRRNDISSTSTLFVASDSFDILNDYGTLVASMRNGRFTSKTSKIYISRSINPNERSDYHTIFLPTAAYRIVNHESKMLDVRIVNRLQSATVMTSAREVMLDTNDAAMTNMVSIDAQQGDSFRVELNSTMPSASGLENMQFSGVSSGALVEIGLIGSELILSGCEEMSITVNGTDVGSAPQLTMRDIAAYDITLDYTLCAYTGKACEPAVTIFNGDYQLVCGVDFTLQYENNTAVGTASVVISGAGAYAGTITRTFEIVDAATACTGGHAFNQGVISAVPESPDDTILTQTCMVCGHVQTTTIPGYAFQVQAQESQQLTLTFTCNTTRRMAGTWCVVVYQGSTPIATHTQAVDVGQGDQVTAAIAVNTSLATSVKAYVVDTQSLAPLTSPWQTKLN